MPSKTQKQAGAMAAACKGKSQLGIPKKVGCEFMRADNAKAKPQPKKGKRHAY